MEKKEIKVTLTHEDFVNSAGYMSSNDCALAVAIKRQMKLREFSVGGHWVRMNGKRYIICESFAKVCPIVSGYKKIHEGGVVEPFTLTLQGR